MQERELPEGVEQTPQPNVSPEVHRQRFEELAGLFHPGEFDRLNEDGSVTIVEAMARRLLERWPEEKGPPEVPNGWLYEATPPAAWTVAIASATSKFAGSEAGQMSGEPNQLRWGVLSDSSTPCCCTTVGYSGV